MEGKVELPLEELLNTGAVDPAFFYQHWFPRTCRQKFSSIHYEIFDALDNSNIRFFNEIIARDLAKTSIARMFMARRISYNVSRTILYIGASEPKANQSIRWVKRQVEWNTPWASFFRLRKGAKWTENEIEVFHGTDEQPIWILGVGITSNSIRGINFDDYRPDLILCDDVLTDENCNTEEGRQQLNKLLGGAVKNSLAPRVDNPNSKMILMNTPQHKEDYAQLCKQTVEWVTIEHGVWTQLTADLPIDEQISVWEDRHPTLDLRQQKRDAEQTGQLGNFMREKEVKLTSPQNAAFRKSWLKYYDEPGAALPPRGTIVISIDPTPPLAPHAVAKNLQQKDFQAVAVCMRSKGNYYLLAYDQIKGHVVEWLTQTIIKMIAQFHPIKVIIETNAAQVAIGILLKQALERQRIYIFIDFKQNTSQKYNRIVSALSGIGFAGKLYCSRTHSDFINNFELYPEVSHDDLLDAVASGMSDLTNPMLEDESQDSYFGNEQMSRPLKIKRRVP